MKHFFTLRYWTKEALGCLLLGAVLCALIFYVLRDMESRRIELEFQQEVDSIAASLYREVLLNFEASQSLALLFANDNLPSEQSFVEQATAIMVRHPSINSLQWLPRVSHRERLALEAQTPPFTIKHLDGKGSLTNAKRQDVYFPVRYLVSAQGTSHLIGLDPSNQVSHRDAMRFADTTGTAHASNALQLMQDEPGSLGVLSYVPVYFTRAKASNSPNLLRGYIAAAYRIPMIYQSAVLEQSAANININIIDTTSSTQQPLYQTQAEQQDLATQEDTYTKPLPVVWGRKWALQATPTQAYLSAKRSILPLALLGASLALTAVLSIFINSLISRAKTINELVHQKSKALGEANRRLEVMCETDALTGLANRRALDRCLLDEWQRATRQSSSLSCLVIDIDHFSTYNDYYGRPQGDVCLRRIGQTLQEQAVRASDMVARYSGEKFVVLLPNTNNVEWIARKCLRAIRKLRIPHEHSDVSDKVTVSIGMSTMWPRPDNTQQELIEKANQALYRAKELGRNRLQIYVEKATDRAVRADG